VRRRDERGFAAIELSAGVALLVLPIVLLVVSLPRWSERQGLARAAAREAARVVGLHGWCDEPAAALAVRRVAADAHLEPTTLRLSLDCLPSVPVARGGTVTARVTVDMPAVDVPLIGAAGQWSWTAQHKEPVDRYGSRP
jgi:hypothetical protein